MRALMMSVVLLAVACGEAEDADYAADSTTVNLNAMDTTGRAVDASTPEGSGPLTVRSLAGTWNGEIRPMDRDTVLVTLQLVGTGNPPTFTLVAPGREAIPLEVSVAGDSIMTVSPIYESLLRAGEQVATSGVYRIENGRMVGTIDAHYRGSTAADSVVQLRATFTRVQ